MTFWRVGGGGWELFFCRGGYGALRAFSMSAFARWFVTHPVQAFVWLHAHIEPMSMPACSLAVAASPAGAPRGFWAVLQEVGADFAMGPWTSVRFSAGVVRRRLSRPGETLAYCGVSG